MLSKQGGKTRKKKEIPEQPVGTVTNEAATASSSADRWMWVGITSIMTIIIVLWVWGMKVRLSSLHWRQMSERSLVHNTQQEWNTLFNTPQEKPDTGHVKEELRALISTLQQQLTASTTTSTKTGD